MTATINNFLPSIGLSFAQLDFYRVKALHCFNQMVVQFIYFCLMEQCGLLKSDINFLLDYFKIPGGGVTKCLTSQNIQFWKPLKMLENLCVRLIYFWVGLKVFTQFQLIRGQHKVSTSSVWFLPWSPHVPKLMDRLLHVWPGRYSIIYPAIRKPVRKRDRQMERRNTRLYEKWLTFHCIIRVY